VHYSLDEKEVCEGALVGRNGMRPNQCKLHIKEEESAVALGSEAKS